MVFFAPVVGVVLFACLAAAAPTPDSAIGPEVAVSAPNGTPISETPTSTPTGGMSYMTTSTMTSMGSYSTPLYGSGNSNWGGSGYDSCVQQCVATYGSVASYTPPATGTIGSSASSGSSSGSGATHTVIVAPTQGVLRYVPFAINASVGDTVMFMWGANNHTVTKSSEFQLCNKTSDAPFVSGEHNKTFVFTQVVNDTNPTFFYCGTPGHCEKGMFGIINPPNANGAPTSAASMMPSMMNDSTMAAMASYTNMKTANNSMAAGWGSSMDMSQMPTWAQPYMAQNIMYTRAFLATNPEVMNSDGSVNLGNAGGNPMVIPMDVAHPLDNAGSSPSPSSSIPSATSTAASSTASASAAAAITKANGGQSLGSSSFLVGVVAVLATFLAI
jgi:plastocyanin